jgi:hypothetical protein
MSKAALTIAVMFGAQVACAAAAPGLFDRVPLNTDTDLLGLPWYGMGKAIRYLVYLLNLAVLAGLMYWLGREDVDWSNFLYVYFGILLGSFLVGVVLNPVLHIFAVVPIVALASFLLARFCSLQPNRAVAVALLYQIYQAGWVLAYKAMAGA